MKELNIALIAGQIIMMLPIWIIDSKWDYLTIYIAAVVLIYFLILWIQERITKKKSPAAATARLGANR